MSKTAIDLLSDEERVRRNQIVRAIQAELETFDPLERAHANRTAVYAVATAVFIGLSPSECLDIRYAAQLHDIGKVKLSPHLRTGELSQAAKQQMQRHPELAMELTAGHEFLNFATELIKSHHEHWDGNGYPKGISGESIPLGSQIINIAEAFDVMTMPISWRASVSEFEALERLQDGAKTQFSSQVTEAFLSQQPIIQPLGIKV